MFVKVPKGFKHDVLLKIAAPPCINIIQTCLAFVTHPTVDTVTERLIDSRDSIGSLDARAAIFTADVAAQTGSGRVRVAETGARTHRVFVVTLTVSCIQDMYKYVVQVHVHVHYVQLHVATSTCTYMYN